MLVVCPDVPQLIGIAVGAFADPSFPQPDQSVSHTSTQLMWATFRLLARRDAAGVRLITRKGNYEENFGQFIFDFFDSIGQSLL